MPKLKRSKEPINPIPPFATSEEEAEFWDTHSVVGNSQTSQQLEISHRNPAEVA